MAYVASVVVVHVGFAEFVLLHLFEEIAAYFMTVNREGFKH
jgi:hypothetical protein